MYAAWFLWVCGIVAMCNTRGQCFGDFVKVWCCRFDGDVIKSCKAGACGSIVVVPTDGCHQSLHAKGTAHSECTMVTLGHGHIFCPTLVTPHTFSPLSHFFTLSGGTRCMSWRRPPCPTSFQAGAPHARLRPTLQPGRSQTTNEGVFDSIFLSLVG